MDKTKKYTVQGIKILHNGKKYLPGSVIELNDEDAERIKIYLILGAKQEDNKPSKTEEPSKTEKTSKAEKANKGSEAKETGEVKTSEQLPIPEVSDKIENK